MQTEENSGEQKKRKWIECLVHHGFPGDAWEFVQDCTSWKAVKNKVQQKFPDKTEFALKIEAIVFHEVGNEILIHTHALP